MYIPIMYSFWKKCAQVQGENKLRKNGWKNPKKQNIIGFLDLVHRLI